MTFFKLTGSVEVERYLREPLERFSTEKMVLLTGPRHVGKTTLAREWLRARRGTHLNFDVAEDREAILRRRFLDAPGLEAVVLDELHKYPRWKSWLKGVYDREGAYLAVVVPGSARLDVFQRGGDSLLGRHEHLRLHPLSVGELVRGGVPSPPEKWDAARESDDHERISARLEKRSGFPEPYFKDHPLQHRRWSTRRRSLLVREDLREISQIRQLALVEHLALLLPSRVGAPLSVNSLREELQVGHDTVSAWLEALERLYFCFRIPPYTKRISRALKKEQKLYLWDWSQVEDPAARFENMVASHLLKSVHSWNDLGYGEFALAYLRDKEKREVDFVLTERRRPVALFECKLTDERPAEALLRFREVLGGLPAVQLVRRTGVDQRSRGVRVVTAGRFLASLA